MRAPDKLSDDPASFELEKVGGAFNPMAESQRENGIQQRVLPENVYTAAIVAWLNNESASEAAIGAAFFTAPPVALTIFLQVTLTYYLQIGVKDYDGDLEAVCLTPTTECCCIRASPPSSASRSATSTPSSRPTTGCTCLGRVSNTRS